MNETNNKVVNFETEEVKESKFKKACAKVGKEIKKHGKAIAIGAGVVVGGVALYILKGKMENPEAKEITDDVVDIIDVSDYADEVSE